jgi:hypothetical protein
MWIQYSSFSKLPMSLSNITSVGHDLTPIIGYAEHFVVHHTYQIYSLGLMRAKAVGSKNRSETELDGVKMINSMIRN